MAVFTPQLKRQK